MIQALWGGQDPCGLRPREDNGKARGRQRETKYGKFLLTLWNWILLRRGVALLSATVDCRTFPLVVNVGSLRHGLSSRGEMEWKTWDARPSWQRGQAFDDEKQDFADPGELEVYRCIGVTDAGRVYRRRW